MAEVRIDQLIYDIQAIVETKENKAIVNAIRKYANEKENFELIVMPEDKLLKILELGAAEYRRLKLDEAREQHLMYVDLDEIIDV